VRTWGREPRRSWPAPAIPAIVRLGRAPLTALFIKATRGAWREAKADEVLGVARQAVALWDGLEGCDFPEVAEDVASEVRIMRALQAQIRELDARCAGLLSEIDPRGLHLSMPGFAERTPTTVAGRLGDASRFHSAAAVRSFVGMIPGTDQSGEREWGPRLTKAGDHLLRTTLWLAADAARKLDPQLARIYHTQMVDKGNITPRPCVPWRRPSCQGWRRFCARAARTRSATWRVRRSTHRRPAGSSPSATPCRPRSWATRRQPPWSQRAKGRLEDGVRNKASRPSPPLDETPGEDAIRVLAEA
jgi:Transposase IS116/IS110/IS902 family